MPDFSDLIAASKKMSEKMKETQEALKKIDISFNENLDKNFVRNLSEKLLEWTCVRWVITLTKKTGQKTFSELQSIKREELLDQEKRGKIYKKFKNIFSDGELLEVKKED
jgi:DNA polymerase-3 subunit gamma/tau